MAGTRLKPAPAAARGAGAARSPHGLRVAIVADETGWHTRQLQAALRLRGARGRCVDLEDCAVDLGHAPHGLVLPGFGTALPDAVLVRGIAGGSFEQVTRRLSILHALQAWGVPVYNSARAIERSVDKGMSSLLLARAGVPTPRAWCSERADQAQAVVAQAARRGQTLVAKPLFGSQGRGLLKVGAVDGATRPLPALTARRWGGVAYLQAFLPRTESPGFDWRVLVIGGRAVAAMRRESAHWVHNVARGARVRAAELTPELARVAEAASAALEMDYAGVDIAPGAQAAQPPLQVLEVNGVAAWHGLQRVTGFNIAQALVDDLLRRHLGCLW